MVKQPKPNQVVTVKIPEDKISKYMKSNATVKEKEDFLAKAVEYYATKRLYTAKKVVCDKIPVSNVG